MGDVGHLLASGGLLGKVGIGGGQDALPGEPGGGGGSPTRRGQLEWTIRGGLGAQGQDGLGRRWVHGAARSVRIGDDEAGRVEVADVMSIAGKAEKRVQKKAGHPPE